MGGPQSSITVNYGGHLRSESACLPGALVFPPQYENVKLLLMGGMVVCQGSGVLDRNRPGSATEGNRISSREHELLCLEELPEVSSERILMPGFDMPPTKRTDVSKTVQFLISTVI